MYSRDSFVQFIGRLARTGGIGSCILLLRPDSYMQRTIAAGSTEAQINEFSMTRAAFLTKAGCFIKKIHDHIDGNINQPCFVQSDQQLCFNCQKIRSESQAEYKKLLRSVETEPSSARLHISPNEESIPSTALSNIQRESEAMTITSSSVSAAINDSINTLEDFGFQSEHVKSLYFIIISKCLN
jgi:superfamily II DNA helicase RecQ